MVNILHNIYIIHVHLYNFEDYKPSTLFVSIPSKDLDFQCYKCNVMIFYCVQLFNVIVSIVDIGGIYYLSFHITKRCTTVNWGKLVADIEKQSIFTKKKGLVSDSNYNKWCKHVQLDIELRDIKQEWLQYLPYSKTCKYSFLKSWTQVRLIVIKLDWTTHRTISVYQNGFFLFFFVLKLVKLNLLHWTKL